MQQTAGIQGQSSVRKPEKRRRGEASAKKKLKVGLVHGIGGARHFVFCKSVSCKKLSMKDILTIST